MSHQKFKFWNTRQHMGWFWDVVDFIPVVGTVARGVEATALGITGQGDAALEALKAAGINAGSDVLGAVTLGAGKVAVTGARGVAKLAGRGAIRAGEEALTKEGVKASARVAARAAREARAAEEAAEYRVRQAAKSQARRAEEEALKEAAKNMPKRVFTEAEKKAAKVAFDKVAKDLETKAGQEALNAVAKNALAPITNFNPASQMSKLWRIVKPTKTDLVIGTGFGALAHMFHHGPEPEDSPPPEDELPSFPGNIDEVPSSLPMGLPSFPGGLQEHAPVAGVEDTKHPQIVEGVNLPSLVQTHFKGHEMAQPVQVDVGYNQTEIMIFLLLLAVGGYILVSEPPSQ